jgi:hypothetical protein
VKYPVVRDEFETIAAVAAGANLARLGDGELKIAYGAGYSREPANRKLTLEMRAVLQSPNEGCIVGIPPLNPESPKYATWQRHAPRFAGVVNFDLTYYSSLVSRPDSAPWIRTQAFIDSVRALWMDKRAVVVCERKGSIFDTVRRYAAKARHIECPTHEAYALIDDLERAVCAANPEIAVLSAGPTATCLANRLAVRGVHAVDLGSAGKFLRGLEC